MHGTIKGQLGEDGSISTSCERCGHRALLQRPRVPNKLKSVFFMLLGVSMFPITLWLFDPETETTIFVVGMIIMGIFLWISSFFNSNE
jgi:drug/metabolite transporter (DMT)-like permease